MRFFKNFRGTFTLNGVEYSNEVLRLNEKQMYEFIRTKAGNRESINIDGVTVDFWRYKNSPEQKAVLHRIMPNESLYWENGVIVCYDVHEYRDGSRSLSIHEKGSRNDGYIGYTCGTRYADGSEDGTYWNQSIMVPTATYEEAVRFFEEKWYELN